MILHKGFKNTVPGLIVLVPSCLLMASLAYAVTLSGLAAPLPESLDVIIDTDPGGDDAMAILLFLSKISKANVLAITVVNGNIDVTNGTRNALLVLQVANRLDIPVYSGSNQGLIFKEESDHFFGLDGLGDTFLNKPEEGLKKSQHAAQALVNYVKEKPGQITVLCIGPLTNIALAVHLYPEFLNNVKNLVILGGSYKGGGNVKPGVEFNMHSDPESAALVFSKIPPGTTATVVPLETVKAVNASLDWRINELGNLDTCFVNFLNRAESISLTKAKEWNPFDQIAALGILNPEIITATEESFITVETCGNHGRGAFFRDDRQSKHNVKLITEINKSLMEELFLYYLNNTSDGCVDVANTAI